MSWVAVAIGGSALVGGGASLFASNKQSKAAQQALQYQQGADARQQKNFAPYLQLGEQATGKLGDIMSGKMDSFFTSPDYNFRVQEGMNALQNSAAARGGLLSGNAMRGITSFGQNLAAGEFQNYWNRNFQAAGLGQNSAAGSGALGAQMAGQIGNTMQAQGAAQASGPVGAANALTGGAQNYLFYNALQNRPGSAYAGSVPFGGYGNSPGQYNPNVAGGFLGYS
jgi:hypothetical protein